MAHPLLRRAQYSRTFDVSAPPIVTVLPFVAMLLAIAVCPLATPRWWHPNRHKLLVAVGLGAPVVLYYLGRDPHVLVIKGEEYVSFILVLAALYVISGGVRLEGDLAATPLTNTGFLAAGSVLASCIGTTGAAMLLIRPLLQTNQERRYVTHTVVFFVFLVANIGGMLTPLGDPPLFLGYLQGVPFLWPAQRLWPAWVALVSGLLIVYVVWDSWAYRREAVTARAADRVHIEPLRLRGGGNVLLLVALVLAVAFLGSPWRELALTGTALLSFATTSPAIRRANGITSYPIVEVTVLFLGLFATMIPVLELLRANSAWLGIHAPWQFFWVTGLLSSVLDNAPTYLAFFALAQGLGGANEVAGVSHAALVAISLGAVVFGAMTYNGNAPNFMVRAIAEGAGVKMPSFFGYLVYSGAVLLPLFGLVTVVFFGR